MLSDLTTGLAYLIFASIVFSIIAWADDSSLFN